MSDVTGFSLLQQLSLEVCSRVNHVLRIMRLIRLYGVVTQVDFLLVCLKRLILTAIPSPHREESQEANITPRTSEIKVDIQRNHHPQPKTFVRKVETSN